MSPRRSSARSTALAALPSKKRRPRICCTAPNLRSQIGDRKSECQQFSFSGFQRFRISPFQDVSTACYNARVLKSATHQPRIIKRGQWIFGGLTLLALWFVLCRHLSGEWSSNEQYSYGWFVPFFALVLLWLRWEDRPEVGGQRPGAGDQTADVRGQSATKSRHLSLVTCHSSLALGIAIAALLLLLPLRVFEIGIPDWRPLGW